MGLLTKKTESGLITDSQVYKAYVQESQKLKTLKAQFEEKRRALVTLQREAVELTEQQQEVMSNRERAGEFLTLMTKIQEKTAQAVEAKKDLETLAAGVEAQQVALRAAIEPLKAEYARRTLVLSDKLSDALSAAHEANAQLRSLRSSLPEQVCNETVHASMSNIANYEGTRTQFLNWVNKAGY